MSPKKLMALAVLAATLGTASSAWAAGGYIGASGGTASWDEDCTGLSLCDKSDSSFKIFTGFHVNPNVAVEVAYVSLGKSRLGSDFTSGGFNNRLRLTTDSAGFDAAAVLRAPVGSRAHVFGKLGVSSMKSTIDLDLNGRILASERDTSVKPLVGLGVSFNVTKQISLRGEWESREIKVAGDKLRISNVTAGVQYGF